MSSPARRTALIFGRSGQVGRAVSECLRDTWRLVMPSESDVDFTHPEGLRDVVRAARPDAIVNAAAYTAVDRAESEPELVERINAEAPGVLAAEAARLGAILIHYSTDYVFDGRSRVPCREDYPTGPLNAYGRSKLHGEQAVLAAGGRAVIIRTSWVYAREGANFLVTMRRLFRERESVRVVDDQIGAPTASHHIAAATVRILQEEPQEDRRGVYHFTAAGATSWCGFARAILALDRSDEVRCREVIGISSSEYPTAAERPRYSVLDSSRIASVFGVRCVPWEDHLREVMDAR